MASSSIVQKLWNYCNALLAFGLPARGTQACARKPPGRPVCVRTCTGREQLMSLLFLKMADERTRIDSGFQGFN